MIKRTFSSLAAALVLAAPASFAVANEWGFDDNYWKRSGDTQRAEAANRGGTDGERYGEVDRYNP